jgi:hypothetical protein
MKQLFLAPALLLTLSSAFAGLVVYDDAAPPPPPTASIPLFRPAPVKEVWIGDVGTSVKAAIAQWSDKAGWSVVWDTKIDDPLMAPVRFEGTFDEAVGQFIRLYERAEQPLVVDIQPGQKVVYITQRRREWR